MSLYWRRNAVAVLTVCLLCALAAGCSNESVEGPDDETYVNPDKPNANDLIMYQATLGDAERGSYIGSLIAEPGEGYYFAGRYDSDNGIGLLSSTGAISWFSDADFAARDMVMLSPSAASPNGLVAVGGIDTDGDNESEIGYVSLYGPSGSLLDHVLYTSDTSDVWLNAIAPLSDSMFVVVGGVRTAAMSAPFVGIIAIGPPGQVEKRGQGAIEALPGRLFDNVVIDPLEQEAGQIVFYVTSGNGSSLSDETTVGVHKVRAGAPGFQTPVVEWSQDIITGWGLNTYTDTGDGLEFYQGDLFVVGYADDPTKVPTPSNGGYWDSGLAASLTPSGGLRWSTVVQLTGHSEYFLGVTVGPDAVYAVGGAADFFRSARQYGYGLISEISIDTGDTLAIMTFGEDINRSRFLSAVLSDDVIHCGGWTGYEVTGGGYVGWFCGIDVSGLPVARRAQGVIPAALGDAFKTSPARDGDLRSSPCAVRRSN
jgi:hypothetical protein